MSNSLENGIADLTRVIGELARDVYRLSQNTANHGSRTANTDYARSYRHSFNMTSPRFMRDPNGFTGQMWDTTTRAFNQMTLGLLPLMDRNFISPMRKLWGDTNKGFIGKIFGSFGVMVKGVFGLMNDLVGRIFSMMKSVLTYGYHEFLKMQKVVGDIAATIGLSRSESRGLLLNMTELTTTAMRYGGSMEDIATIMSTISDVTGKNRLINPDDVDNIERLGRGTGLGIDGLSKISGEFSNLGISMNKTFSLIDKAREGASKLGLNVTTVLKTYNTLVTSLTGFQMKSGLDNMVKLATQATQLRMELTGVAEQMSSAFFEPEGAVEAAAKMQVLGGQFAEKFGDAFTLMYKAQVSPEMFQKDLMEMVKGLSVKGDNGLFYVPPAQMRMIQESAKILGVNAKELINGAIEQGKMADKISAMSQNGFLFKNNEDREAISNLVRFDQSKGGYIIQLLNGQEKLLSNVNQSQLDNLLREKKADDDAAKRRMNFSERLSTVFNRFYMNFAHVFAEIFDRLESSGLFELLENGLDKLSKTIIPAIKKFFDDKDGIGKYITNIFDKIKFVFEKVFDILQDPNKSILGAIKDATIMMVKGVWSTVSPYIEAGFAKLLMAIGKATGFDTVTGWGEKMMLNVAKENMSDANIQKLTGSKSEKEKYLANVKGRDNDITFKQGLMIGGITALAAALAPFTAGGSLAVGTAALGSYVGAKVYNANTSENADQKYGGVIQGTDNVNDAIVTRSGRVLKGAKGDVAALFDESGVKNAAKGGQSNQIVHSGVITVKSEDGKQITISDLEKIGRYTLAQYIDSINHGMKNGTAIYNNERMPIAPIG